MKSSILAPSLRANFLITLFCCYWTVASPTLRSRSVIPPTPAYVVLSSGSYQDYTLLASPGRSKRVVTAGPADPYSITKLPPKTALQGEFVGVKNNKFLPDNRAWRRPFEVFEVGVLKVGSQCLKATLQAPYVTLASCPQGALKDASLTWVNWGPSLNRGLGGYIEPYGNLNAKALRTGNLTPLDTWGLAQNQDWRSTGKPLVMSTREGSHVTVINYNNEGIVSNQTVGF
ncbi:hypothetical protein O181_024576 [Austropuccinia psidii MF-1]|uniref:Uncharacterized protein n=1 Tax=Austropuccinia psidii MF-1 TaxID=1389203 RepID=A0A9Q3CGZ9_9BASI|nr:hypothetical protein [Austropuccinia psidii MF-1]